MTMTIHDPTGTSPSCSVRPPARASSLSLYAHLASGRGGRSARPRLPHPRNPGWNPAASGHADRTGPCGLRERRPRRGARPIGRQGKPPDPAGPQAAGRGRPPTRGIFQRAAKEFRPRLDLRLSAGFRRLVLTYLPAISYGETATTSPWRPPCATRKPCAPSHRVATNPLPVVIPCHRIIRSDGRLGSLTRAPISRASCSTWRPTDDRRRDWGRAGLPGESGGR